MDLYLLLSHQWLVRLFKSPAECEALHREGRRLKQRFQTPLYLTKAVIIHLCAGLRELGVPLECWGDSAGAHFSRGHYASSRSSPGCAVCVTVTLPSRAAINSPGISQLSDPQGWKPVMSKAGTTHEPKPL